MKVFCAHSRYITPPCALQFPFHCCFTRYVFYLLIAFHADAGPPNRTPDLETSGEETETPCTADIRQREKINGFARQGGEARGNGKGAAENDDKQQKSRIHSGR